MSARRKKFGGFQIPSLTYLKGVKKFNDNNNGICSKFAGLKL